MMIGLRCIIANRVTTITDHATRTRQLSAASTSAGSSTTNNDPTNSNGFSRMPTVNPAKLATVSAAPSLVRAVGIGSAARLAKKVGTSRTALASTPMTPRSANASSDLRTGARVAIVQHSRKMPAPRLDMMAV